MSWSFYAAGSTSAVKKQASAQLSKQIENCSSIPAEKYAIKGFADALDAVLDSAKGQAIRASGSGSAWLENGLLKSFSYESKIEVFDMQEPK